MYPEQVLADGIAIPKKAGAECVDAKQCQECQAGTLGGGQ